MTNVDKMTKKELEYNLHKLSHKLLNKNKLFIDNSRIICCSCVFLSNLGLFMIFYLMDNIKSKAYCENNSSLSSLIEVCEIPGFSFSLKLSITLSLMVIIVLSMYCIGNTEVLFEPKENRIIINKKKLLILPSIEEYKLSDFKQANCESDHSITDGPKISSFNFYAVLLIFKKDKICLGFGRDCFCLHKKVKLVNKINNYYFCLSTLLPDIDK